MSKKNKKHSYEDRLKYMRMMEEEIIYRAPDGYMVYDRFFGQWLDDKF